MQTPLATPSDSPQAPLQIREIQELAIAITAKALNPTMVTQDFLQLSGIVPSDWQMRKQPVLTAGQSQIVYQNGVTITAQPRTVTFAQAIPNDSPELQIGDVARKFIFKLPNAEYQSLNISPRCLVPLVGEVNAAQKFITETLMSPGPWLELGQAPVQAGLNLLYRLEQCQLNLTINEARLQTPDGRSIPALLFSGNFLYAIAKEAQEERLNSLGELLNNWKTDLETFREVVNQRFLQKAPVAQENDLPLTVFNS